jgi:hypothetical protein
METCNGVKIHATKTMKNEERSWDVASFAYYAGRKFGALQTTTNHYSATPMSLALAEQLVAKLTLAGMKAEVCDLYADPETVVNETMIQIGEEAPPPVPPPSSLQELSRAIESCFRQGLSPLEVITFCNKTILCC